MGDHDVAADTTTTPSGERDTSSSSSLADGRSTIQEETEPSISDDPIAQDFLTDHLQHHDPEFQKLLESIPSHSDLLVDTTAEPVPHDDVADRLPLSLLTAPAEELILAPPIELNK